MKRILTGGRVVDPSTGRDEIADVLLHGEQIVAVGNDLDATGAERMDCDGLLVMPGLVDLRAHLGEPGHEDAEDIASASAAAAAGGYTAVCATPDTDPVCDSTAVAEQIWRRGIEVGLIDVLPTATLTKARQGEDLTEFGGLRRCAAAVDFFSDGDRTVGDALLMRRAMQYALAFDVVIANHPQDGPLTEGAQMHEGAQSSRLGLPGAPAEAEDIMVARDLILARGSGARIHLQRISTAGAVELIRVAKAQGVRVTADCTPHHLVLDDSVVAAYDPVHKVVPPLRSPEDVAALRAAVADGTIDAIATDHAPVSVELKEQEWEHAPPGTIGLETTLALLLGELVETGVMSLTTLVDRLTRGPSLVRDTRGHGGPIMTGAPANLTCVDPAATWVVAPRTMQSRSRNSAFTGRKLTGRVVHTMLRGRLTFTDGAVQH